MTTIKLSAEDKQKLSELLAIEWNNSQSMVKHCLKSKYIKLDDGTFLTVGDGKPSIESDLWYDDETDGPDASKFEAFSAYNLRGKERQFTAKSNNYGWDKYLYIVPQWRGDKTNGQLLGLRYEDGSYTGGRRATEAEVIAINAAAAEILEDYKKRLAAYWKRYSHKVHARGYWANR